MGATSTLVVSRRNALAALATIEFSSLSDKEVEDRLNAALSGGGYSLDEVSISSYNDDYDANRLEEMAITVSR